jgi:hypothetical protein
MLPVILHLLKLSCYFIMPLLIIAGGLLCCMQVWKLRKGNKLGRLLSSYIVGTTIWALWWPAAYLMIIIAFAIPGGGLVGALTAKSPPIWDDFDVLKTSKTWAMGIPYFWLAACGPGGSLGIAALFVHQFFLGKKARTGERADVVSPGDGRQTKVEVVVVTLLFLIGWTVSFIWPVDFTLDPPP